MKNKPVLLLGALALFASLGACGFVGQQLADKAREERLLKPGALDRRMTDVYDTYQFKFLDKYRITHEWPRNSKGCQYAGLPTLNVKDGFYGEFYAIRDIYEEGDSTKQRDAHSTWNFDRFVRPTYKMQRPEFDAAGKKTGRMLEKDETGLEPVCFEAWVGTSHAMTLMLYKRTVDEWQSALSQWSQGSYVGPGSRKFTDDVSGNRWHVYRVEPKPRIANRIAGAFELRILPIGSSNYTLAIELAANQDSLQHPQAHANVQAMFRHLIESVKIEEIKP